jgi:hypothetical protein
MKRLYTPGSFTVSMKVMRVVPAGMLSLPLDAEAVATVLFALSMFATNELRTELNALSTWMPATSQLSVMSVEPTVRASSAAMVTTTPVCPGAIGSGLSTETVSVRGETVSAWLTCSTVGLPPSFSPELRMLLAASGVGHKPGFI